MSASPSEPDPRHDSKEAKAVEQSAITVSWNLGSDQWRTDGSGDTVHVACSTLDEVIRELINYGWEITTTVPTAWETTDHPQAASSGFITSVLILIKKVS